MININKYITEKLHLDKDIEISQSKSDVPYVHPEEKDAEDACKSFKTDNVMYCKYANGRNHAGKVKLMLDNEHFYIKTEAAKNVNDSLPDTPHVSHSILNDLVKAGLGDSYVINAYQSRIDTSSRINNLKRTYHYFYFDENGMIFKDKKEANAILKAAKQDYKLSGQYRFKVITIEDAANMKGSVYGDSIEDVKFIQK
ncbi:MAG: hypothetical protein IJH39_05870 [Clostridia bacterium]|nr:hypothetical protein [Clostridia bacterium]